jgi:hypothetical protein
MPIQCRSDKDCTTANLCINETCVPLTPANLAAKVPIWGWAIVAFAIVLIIFGLVRCLCWPKKRSNSNHSRFGSPSDNKGPVPLPSHYKKPVDLLEVADANRRADNSQLQRQEPSVNLLPRLEGSVGSLRKPSDDSSVYPSSSISQSQYATYEQDDYPAQPAYPKMQQQYGFQNQPGYASNSNQVYYGNNASQQGADYDSNNQVNYSKSQNMNKSQKINKKLQNYDYRQQDYGYQTEF